MIHSTVTGFFKRHFSGILIKFFLDALRTPTYFLEKVHIGIPAVPVIYFLEKVQIGIPAVPVIF